MFVDKSFLECNDLLQQLLPYTQLGRLDLAQNGESDWNRLVAADLLYTLSQLLDYDVLLHIFSYILLLHSSQMIIAKMNQFGKLREKMLSERPHAIEPPLPLTIPIHHCTQEVPQEHLLTEKNPRFFLSSQKPSESRGKRPPNLDDTNDEEDRAIVQHTKYPKS